MRYVVTNIDCIHFSNAEPGCAAINRVIQASSGIHKLLAIVTSDLHEKFLPWTWSIEPSVASSPWIDQSIDEKRSRIRCASLVRLIALHRFVASLPCLSSNARDHYPPYNYTCPWHGRLLLLTNDLVYPVVSRDATF